MIRGGAAEQKLREWLDRPTLVLTIGHPWHGDDAAGPRVCAAAGSPQVVDCGDAPERYLGLANDAQVAQVLFVDAVEFGGTPGETVFCRPEDLTERAGTTHTMGLAVLTRYITESFGKPTAVLGIQPAQTQFGAPMSQAVTDAAAALGALLRECAAARAAEREAA